MPSDFLLRIPARADEDRPAWVRRNLFSVIEPAWSRTWLQELGTIFKTREEALAFAVSMKLAGEAELVTMTSEEIQRA